MRQSTRHRTITTQAFSHPVFKKSPKCFFALVEGTDSIGKDFRFWVEGETKRATHARGAWAAHKRNKGR